MEPERLERARRELAARAQEEAAIRAAGAEEQLAYWEAVSELSRWWSERSRRAQKRPDTNVGRWHKAWNLGVCVDRRTDAHRTWAIDRKGRLSYRPFLSTFWRPLRARGRDDLSELEVEWLHDAVARKAVELGIDRDPGSSGGG